MARQRTFRRGPRRPTDWSASIALTSYTALAAASAVISEVFVPIVGGETLIRTRGLFSFATDQEAANETQVGAFGIGIVSEQAATVGATAVPHPFTDAAWGGWLYHTYFASRFRFVSGVGVSFADGVTTQVIDSKAMRKIGENERLIVVVENIAAQGMVFWNSERFLTKVH